MQFLARSLSKSIRQLNSSARHSSVPSQRCHPNFCTSSTLVTGGDDKPESMTPVKSSDWPRPMEIPYHPKIENSVDLIGYLKYSVELPDGEVSAATLLTREPSDGSVSEFDSPNNFRIPIIFEGDLARTASCLLKKGDRVHVNGQVYVEFLPFCFKSENGAPISHVLVREFHQVLPDHWSDLVKKPDQWVDFRERKENGKVNSRFPDFKKKDGSVSLWLNKAPNEILSKLQDVKIPTKDDSWKDLVQNKKKWWDCRLTKTSEKAPDFKHRETGEALWLSDCPSWLLEELPPLES